MASYVTTIVESNNKESFGIFTTVGYNGFFESPSKTNKARASSINLNRFDVLRCELEAQGIDRFGSQLIAKEFLKLVQDGSYTWGEIYDKARNYNVLQSGMRFTQLYLDALNRNRATSSRLDLIGDEPIPRHVDRAIIF